MRMAGMEALKMVPNRNVLTPKVRDDGYLLTVRAEVYNSAKLISSRERRTQEALEKLGKKGREEIPAQQAEANNIRVRVYSILKDYTINLGPLGYYVLSENQERIEFALKELSTIVEKFNEGAAFNENPFRIRFSYLMLPASAGHIGPALEGRLTETLSAIYMLLREGDGAKALTLIKANSDIPFAFTNRAQFADVLRRATNDAERLKRAKAPEAEGKAMDLGYIAQFEE